MAHSKGSAGKFILLTAVVLLASTRAAAAGVLTADTFVADIKLAAKTKGRKQGPKEAVGPLPTGLAWDGEWRLGKSHGWWWWCSWHAVLSTTTFSAALS